MKLTEKMKIIGDKQITREKRLSKEQVADRSEDLANVVLEIALTEDTHMINLKQMKDSFKAEIDALSERRDTLAQQVSRKREETTLEALYVVDPEQRKVHTVVPLQSSQEDLDAGIIDKENLEYEVLDSRIARSDELQEDLI